MALHLLWDNITVTVIAPGAFASDMNKDARDHSESPIAYASGSNG